MEPHHPPSLGIISYQHVGFLDVETQTVTFQSTNVTLADVWKRLMLLSMFNPVHDGLKRQSTRPANFRTV